MVDVNIIHATTQRCGLFLNPCVEEKTESISGEHDVAYIIFIPITT